MHAITIGPLVFATDRFAAILGIGVFLLAATVLARRLDERLAPWATSAVLGGIVLSRLEHVLSHWSSFSNELWRVFAIWQGGFGLLGGLLGVVLVSVFYVRSARFAAGAAVALLLGGVAGVMTHQLTMATYGQAAPLSRMAGLDGNFRSIRDFAGRPVVVNLWASWCPPCRREMPLLAQTAAEQTDVAFLFVNQGESSETIRRYLARDRLELGHVLLDPAMAVSRHYAAPGLPVTLFLRSDGTLASLHTGEISREALAAGLDGIRREAR